MRALLLLSLLTTGCSLLEPKEDDDGDGFNEDEDCDDDDLNVNPNASEICDDEDVDEDCDGDVNSDDHDAIGKITVYEDADGDGHGVQDEPSEACDADEDHARVFGDCDDDDPEIHPGADEICDADDVDEDCDGLVDDADDSLIEMTRNSFWEDDDQDGFGDEDAIVEACDPGEGVAATPGDCDDRDPNAFPGGVEVCNGNDDDCNGSVDDNATDSRNWYTDDDGDGYGANATARDGCEALDDEVSQPGDCDDSNDEVFPGAVEVCNRLDDDCDGATDPDTARDADTWYRDSDGDGYGNSLITDVACEEPAGYAALSTDCDDTASGVHPGATEVCDAANTDENCNGTADDNDGTVLSSSEDRWYRDSDGDGYGTSRTSTTACELPAGYVADDTDCDDGDFRTNPGGTEVCDAADDDEDCDGRTDDEDASVDPATYNTYYVDSDRDGYGSSTAPALAECDDTSTTASNASDCDDGDAGINPAEYEVCDAADTDEDCDGLADDDDGNVRSSTRSTWYADTDLDGYGGRNTSTSACDAPAGFLATSNDCSDGDATIHPNAPESCDGQDNDCDASVDEAGAIDAPSWSRDVDRDNHGNSGVVSVACTQPSGYVSASDDCDDTDDRIYPGAPELCDGEDQDCDGTVDDDAGSSVYLDADGDGYGDAASSIIACSAGGGYVSNGTDCDDADPTLNPGVPEDCGDAIDNDCDGIIDTDAALQQATVLSTDTTWTSDRSVCLAGEVVIAYGATLTIEAGALVVDSGGKLTVNGELSVVGSAAEPVVFEGVDVQPNLNASASSAPNVEISYANWYDGTLFGNSNGSYFAGLTLTDSVFIGLDQHIYLWYPDTVDIERNIFVDSNGISIGTSGVDAYIYNNVFYNAYPFAVMPFDTSLSTLYIQYNSFMALTGYAIYTDCADQPLDVDLRFNYWETTDLSAIDALVYDAGEDTACTQTYDTVGALSDHDLLTPDPTPWIP